MFPFGEIFCPALQVAIALPTYPLCEWEPHMRICDSCVERFSNEMLDKDASTQL